MKPEKEEWILKYLRRDSILHLYVMWDGEMSDSPLARKSQENNLRLFSEMRSPKLLSQLRDRVRQVHGLYPG
jgi:hypothetical protein